MNGLFLNDWLVTNENSIDCCELCIKNMNCKNAEERYEDSDVSERIVWKKENKFGFSPFLKTKLLYHWYYQERVVYEALLKIRETTDEGMNDSEGELLFEEVEREWLEALGVGDGDDDIKDDEYESEVDEEDADSSDDTDDE